MQFLDHFNRLINGSLTEFRQVELFQILDVLDHIGDSLS